MPTIVHCLCGAVRASIDATRVFEPEICHCESCRRASGAPLIADFAVPETAWRWTGETPRAYASSPGITRSFCPTCGTPMAFHSAEQSEITRFYMATLTDPEAIRPTRAIRTEEALSWSGSIPLLPVRTETVGD